MVVKAEEGYSFLELLSSVVVAASDPNFAHWSSLGSCPHDPNRGWEAAKRQDLARCAGSEKD